MQTLQSVLNSLTFRNGSAPFKKPLKVIICGISDAHIYRNERNEEKKMWTIGLADHSMIIKGILYHEEYVSKFVVGHCILVINAIVKTNPASLVITRESLVRRSGGITISDDQRRQAALIACPPPAPEVPLIKVGSSPIKAMLTVVGRIVSEEVTRTVPVKGKAVSIKTVELEDRSGKCRVTLWRDLAENKTAVGTYIKVTEAVVQSYKDEKSLSTTYKTKLTTVDCPQETKEMALIAFEKEELEYSLTFQEDENFPTFKADKECLKKALGCTEEAVEDALADKIPVTVRVTIVNGRITDMAIL